MNIFDEIFTLNNRRHFPVDIMEKDNAYELEMEIPGISKENVEIIVEHDHIEIKISDDEDSENQYIHKERPVGKYSRRMNFGKPVDAINASSSIKNGILTINLPYAEMAKRVSLSINWINDINIDRKNSIIHPHSSPRTKY